MCPDIAKGALDEGAQNPPWLRATGINQQSFVQRVGSNTLTTSTP